MEFINKELLNKEFIDENFKDIYRIYNCLVSRSMDGMIIAKLMLCSEMRHFLNLKGEKLYKASEEIFQDWIDSGDEDMAAMVEKYGYDNGLL